MYENDNNKLKELVRMLIESDNVRQFKLEIVNYVGTKTIYRKDVECIDD